MAETVTCQVSNQVGRSAFQAKRSGAQERDALRTALKGQNYGGESRQRAPGVAAICTQSNKTQLVLSRYNSCRIARVAAVR